MVICAGQHEIILVLQTGLISQQSGSNTQAAQQILIKSNVQCPTLQRQGGCTQSMRDLSLLSAGNMQYCEHRFNVAVMAQASVERTVGRMAVLGLCPASECGVFFGQLLGMADHLTFTLGRSGYRVRRHAAEVLVEGRVSCDGCPRQDV